MPVVVVIVGLALALAITLGSWWIWPRYLLSFYRRYRGDPYWSYSRPWARRVVLWPFVLLAGLTLGGVFALSLQSSRPISWLLSIILIGITINVLAGLAWLDCKLRVLPNEWLLVVGGIGVLYHGIFGQFNILLQTLVVGLGVGCVKIMAGLLQGCGVRNYQPAFGAGDVKMILSLLCWFWLAELLVVLTVASGSALVYVLLYRCRSQWLRVVPFGPFLSLGAYAMWLIRAAV